MEDMNEHINNLKDSIKRTSIELFEKWVDTHGKDSPKNLSVYNSILLSIVFEAVESEIQAQSLTKSQATEFINSIIDKIIIGFIDFKKIILSKFDDVNYTRDTLYPLLEMYKEKNKGKLDLSNEQEIYKHFHEHMQG